MPVLEEEHTWLTALCTSCATPYVFPVACGDRFCDVCQGYRRVRTWRVLQYITRAYQPRPGERLTHIVLTLRSESDLSGMLDHIVAAFRRFRQRQMWRAKVSGGCYVIEITGAPAAWHVHLHVVCSTLYWSKHALSREWARCSGSSYTWITRCRQQHAVAYLTKYLSKSVLPPAHQDLAASALKGRRLFQPFGSWQGLAQGFVQPLMTCPRCGADSFVILDFMPGYQEHLRAARDSHFSLQPRASPSETNDPSG